ncbi:protealysin inhibitor emfourin [Angustibacter aerolatus]
MTRPLCHIVPPYLVDRLGADPLALVRERRLLVSGTRPLATVLARAADADPGTGPQRTISDAHGTETLPGDQVRAEGGDPTGDAAADEAYDGLGATWSLFSTAYGRDSLDGQGLPLDATVHYGERYDNAFWDGSRMVFGDGDGTTFNRFTISVDVIGHELTHGVTEKTANLTYQGQSGALNESVSDVFGSLVKQHLLGQSAASADWLIGEGLFTDAVQGVALRSMKAPGTAYDDPTLGKDPQPASMADLVDTSDDNGGVHINSGIPNRAFYLAATAIGGNAWEGAGAVWYDTLTGGSLEPDADFATFAAATVTAATARFGEGSPQAAAVADAWAQVGVLSSSSSGDAGQPTTSGAGGPGGSGGTPQLDLAGRTVRVRRSGGFTGVPLEREVRLDELPDTEAQRWLQVLGSGELLDLAAASGEPAPDRYVYQVVSPQPGLLDAGTGLDVRAGEQQLPGAVRSLLDDTLRGL